MARYQIILAYDGTHFLGSQRQGASRTIQGELEKGLCKLGWDGRTVYLAGRTDTGTHAIGQVAAFDLDWGHGLVSLRKALNTYLPRDMAVREVILAADSFHPRFDARSRLYRYRLFCTGVRDPLRERYAWRVWPAVSDLAPLAAIWPGTHDFGAFGTPPRTDGSTVRRVFSAKWTNDGNEWTFDIQADAFLYRMVRRLVYVQVAVGQGRIPAEDLVRALNNDPMLTRGIGKKGQGHLPASLAPASGLTLVEVRYDNLD
ncbi:MAG: tRNA pseudouridine synthase A [Anaerolineales bacterium]|jgi:tRNA pseudouridine38-40 synthase